jgi:hypothetical protein
MRTHSVSAARQSDHRTGIGLPGTGSRGFGRDPTSAGVEVHSDLRDLHLSIPPYTLPIARTSMHAIKARRVAATTWTEGSAGTQAVVRSAPRRSGSPVGLAHPGRGAIWIRSVQAHLRRRLVVSRSGLPPTVLVADHIRAGTEVMPRRANDP